MSDESINHNKPEPVDFDPDMVLEQGALEDTLQQQELPQGDDDDQNQDDEELVGLENAGHELRHIYYRLQAEETLDNQAESIEKSVYPPLLFSPEGNEGFIFTALSMTTEASKNTPREINEAALLQRYSHAGQDARLDQAQETFDGSIDQDGLRARSEESQADHGSSTEQHNNGQNSEGKEKPKKLDLQEQQYQLEQQLQRMRQKRRADEPGLQPIDKIEARMTNLKAAFGGLKLTPRENLTDTPFEESFTSVESTASPRSGGNLTDRATSPSAASVASLQSVSSQVSVSGRRFLEWDYGSDLGYLEGQQTQVEAAQSLSTLEKLAIGNYTEYLRDEDEEKDENGRNMARSRPLLAQDAFCEETNVRMKKFADSLMRQRQIREQELARSERRIMEKSPKRPVSKTIVNNNSTDAGRKTVHKGSLLDPGSSKYFSSPERQKRRNPDPSTRIKRSLSLGEMPGLVRDKEGANRSSSAANIVLAKWQGSGPSSSSSCGTVVSGRRKLPAAAISGRPNHLQVLEAVATASLAAPSDLPPHLEDLVIETDSRDSRSPSISKLGPQSRQSSRVSVSNSFETVIAMGRGASVGKDSLDTEDETHAASNGGPIKRPPLNALITSTLRAGDRKYPMSGNSSVPSTSDEENELRRRRRRPLRPETAEDTSTMESVQLIDRAKSFEYIPGESFPLQENSSSYEYLPGHLVPDQRPPTVLDVEHDRVPKPSHNQEDKEGSSTVHARDVQPKGEPADRIAPSQGIEAFNLDLITLELRDKSKELLTANLAQTKHFFKKLKRYINFLSTPSESVEECRLKQMLATKITRLLASEESRLEQSSELSHTASSLSNCSSRLLSASGNISSGCVPIFPLYPQRPSQRPSSAYGMPAREDAAQQPRPDSGRLVCDSNQSSSPSKAFPPQTTARSVPLDHGRIISTSAPAVQKLSSSNKAQLSSAASGRSGTPVLVTGSSTRPTVLSPFESDQSNHLQGVTGHHKKNREGSLRSASGPLPAETSQSTCTTESDQYSFQLPQARKQARTWETGKTRSEEDYERGRSTKGAAQGSLLSMDELRRKRTEHLSILKREIERLERLEKRLPAGETSLASPERRLPTGEASFGNSASGTTKASPTRKLTYTKGSARADDTTVTEAFTVSRDAVDEGHVTRTREVKKKNNTQINTFQSSEKSSTLSLLSESSSRSLRKGVVSEQAGFVDNGKVKTAGEATIAAAHILSQTDTIQVVAHFESLTEDSLMGPPERRAPPDIDSTQTTFSSSSGLLIQRTTHWNKENRRRRQKEKRQRKKSPRNKSVAYYLPLTSMSPVRLGTRLLKESLPIRQVNSFRNRNILSQYMANLDHELPRARATVPSRSREDTNQLAKLSLQDALRHRRPDFVRKSEGRVAILHQIRAAREKRAERHEAWLQDIRCMSPASRREARPVFSPRPVLRLFTHQEMVAATRSKYIALPEVLDMKKAEKRQGKDETNRIRKDIYSRQLKRRLKCGKVSLTHHDRIL